MSSLSGNALQVEFQALFRLGWRFRYFARRDMEQCMIGMGKRDNHKDAGAERLAPSDVVCLYHRAFRDFGAQALWNLRHVEHPTSAQALAITRQLRIEGNMEARRLAEAIERACGADL